MIWTIARKDLTTIFRDRSALLFIFALPLVFIFVFGAAFGRSSEDEKPLVVTVLVSNADTGKHGEELIEAMRSVGLNPELEPKGADALTARMEKGDAPLGVIIPQDFSVKLDRTITVALDRTGKVEAVPLKALVDPAKPQVAGMAQGALSGATRKVTGQIFGKKIASLYGASNDTPTSSMEQELISIDLKKTNELAGAQIKKRHSPGDVMIPGFAVYFVFFLANGVAATLITEREQGTLRRMLSAPLTRFQILTGKLLARFMLGILQTVFMFFVGTLYMNLHLSGAYLSVTVIALATIFSATTLGMLIATMGKTLEQIQGMITLVMLMMGFLSGCLVPRELLPAALQKLSYITPHAWALTAYQDVLLRDRPLLATLPNIGMTLAFGVVFLALALRRFRYE